MHLSGSLAAASNVTYFILEWHGALDCACDWQAALTAGER